MPNMKNEDYKKHDVYMSLCKEMGRPEGIPYGLLLDHFITASTGEISIDPQKVERYILATKGYTVGDCESLYSVVSNLYSPKAAELMESLF